ncbi:hypothetical protein NM688_g8314 [Phlebia brevispora]|uniref:Uncharacterized protein n=1 Tax=Phlebia brevispora TaxID=194682 RepID=A0ACC1RUR6_9APHY|nr:hypothetical protein NM688_g8314 [Phlebia brevispora]
MTTPSKHLLDRSLVDISVTSARLEMIIITSRYSSGPPFAPSSGVQTPAKRLALLLYERRVAGRLAPLTPLGPPLPLTMFTLPQYPMSNPPLANEPTTLDMSNNLIGLQQGGQGSTDMTAGPYISSATSGVAPGQTSPAQEAVVGELSEGLKNSRDLDDLLNGLATRHPGAWDQRIPFAVLNVVKDEVAHILNTHDQVLARLVECLIDSMKDTFFRKMSVNRRVFARRLAKFYQERASALDADLQHVSIPGNVYIPGNGSQPLAEKGALSPFWTHVPPPYINGNDPSMQELARNINKEFAQLRACAGTAMNGECRSATLGSTVTEHPRERTNESGGPSISLPHVPAATPTTFDSATSPTTAVQPAMLIPFAEPTIPATFLHPPTPDLAAPGSSPFNPITIDAQGEATTPARASHDVHGRRS